jgi:hypothetical protein
MSTAFITTPFVLKLKPLFSVLDPSLDPSLL